MEILLHSNYIAKRLLARKGGRREWTYSRGEVNEKD